MEKDYVIGIIGCGKKFTLSDYLKTKYKINVLDERVFDDILRLEKIKFANVVKENENVSNLGRQIVLKKLIL